MEYISKCCCVRLGNIYAISADNANHVFFIISMHLRFQLVLLMQFVAGHMGLAIDLPMLDNWMQ